MQLSGSILSEGSSSWRDSSKVLSFQTSDENYLDWLPLLHRTHGWHGLLKWTWDVTCQELC